MSDLGCFMVDVNESGCYFVAPCDDGDFEPAVAMNVFLIRDDSRE